MENKLLKKYRFRDDMRYFFSYFIQVLDEIKSDFAQAQEVERKMRKKWPKLESFKNSPRYTKGLVSECFLLCGWRFYSHNQCSGKTYTRGYLTEEEFEKLEDWAMYLLPKEIMLRNS